MILRPGNPKCESIFLVYHNDMQVRVKGDKNYDFIDVVKDFGCKWSWNESIWYRDIGYLSMPVIDRCAELASILINKDFIVEVKDKIAKMVINQSYDLECKKWILRGKGNFSDYLRIYWKHPFDLYCEAMRINGSIYDSITKCVCISANNFEEVLDFADIYNCKIDSEAWKIIEKAKKLKNSQIEISLDLKKEVTQEISRPKLFAPKTTEIVDNFVDCRFLPEHFKLISSPYNHQKAAIEKLKNLTIGALFMEMGTGKSYTAIYLSYLRQHRINNIVWITTVNLKQTVYEEIRKHTNTSDIYLFDDKTTIDNIPESLFYIVGIESISSSDRQTLCLNQIINKHSFVIIDESDKIKGHKSKRTKRLTTICEKAKYKLIMTGTPISQGIVDLYSQMYFLSPQILGYSSFYSFAHNHLEYSDKYPGLIVRSHNIDFITSKIQPYTYQITKEECLDLPEKIFEKRYCVLTTEQHKYYEQAKYDILMSVEEIDSYTIFQLFSALQQITSGFWNKEGKLIEIENNRLDCLLSLLHSMPDTEKVIIWCKYQYSLHQINKKLDNTCIYYGALSKTEKEKELDKFRNERKYLISTASSGGRGLTLTECAYSVFYENEFKYSNRLQAEDRIHRIGQTRKPTYIDIISNAGIDRRIMESIAKKENTTQSFKRKLNEFKDINPDEMKKKLLELI